MKSLPTKRVFIRGLYVAIVSVLVLFVVVTLKTAPVEADPTDRVHGFAWGGVDTGNETGGIGWLSLNCTGEPNGCSPLNGSYGVDVDASGNLTGYGWFDTIGWVDFDPSGAYPAAGPGRGVANASARVATWPPPTGVATPVEGWARVLAHDTTWDGWIALSGDWGGWSITPTSQTTADITGFAWGGDTVVGWLEATNITVNIDPQAPGSGSIELTATNLTVNPGGTTDLEWHSPDNTDFTSCEIGAVDHPTSTTLFTQTVGPNNWDYTNSSDDIISTEVPNNTNGYGPFTRSTVEVGVGSGATGTRYFIRCFDSVNSTWETDYADTYINVPTYSVSLGSNPPCLQEPGSVDISWTLTSSNDDFQSCSSSAVPNATGWPPSIINATDGTHSQTVNLTQTNTQYTFNMSCTPTLGGTVQAQPLTVHVWDGCNPDPQSPTPIIEEF